MTRDIDALELLPEGESTGLRYRYYSRFNFQANLNACVLTCGVTQINAA